MTKEVKYTQNVAKFAVAMSNNLGGIAFIRKYIIWSWPWRQVHMEHCLVLSTVCDYAPTKFEVATSNVLGGDAFTRKYIIWPLTLTLGPRSHKTLPSTLLSRYKWTSKTCSCYDQLFRSSCIYKEKHYLNLTLGSTPQETLLSTLYIMWPLCTWEVWSCYIQRFWR